MLRMGTLALFPNHGGHNYFTAGLQWGEAVHFSLGMALFCFVLSVDQVEGYGIYDTLSFKILLVSPRLVLYLMAST